MRIEFQRSRGEDDRHYDDHRQTPYYESGGDRPQNGSSGAYRRSKRGGPPFNEPPMGGDIYGGDMDGSGGHPPYKRARYFDSNADGRGEYGGRGGSSRGASHSGSGGPSTYGRHGLNHSGSGYGQYKQDHPLAAWSHMHQDRPEQPRATIFLCDILRRLKPHLFGNEANNYAVATAAPNPVMAQQQQPPVSLLPPVYQQQQSGPEFQQQPQQQAQQQYVVAPVPQPTHIPSVHTGSDGVVFQGFLARNNKRKVPVEVVAIDGSVEAFLTPVRG